MLDPIFLGKPFAHRGLWDATRPENSLGAITAAADAGYGVELDLQLSSDGQAMVFHDETLDRMTDHEGWVAGTEAHSLGEISLANSSETIPTFAEVLDAVGGRVPILAELKDPTATPGGTLGPLETRVTRDLKSYSGHVAVMSFHPGVVKNLARMAPDIPRGIVGMQYDPEKYGEDVAEALNDYAAFEETGSSFVSHSWRDLAMPAISRLKSKGVPILCWTVRARVEDVFARKIADNVTFEGYVPA